MTTNLSHRTAPVEPSQRIPHLCVYERVLLWPTTAVKKVLHAAYHYLLLGSTAFNHHITQAIALSVVVGLKLKIEKL